MFFTLILYQLHTMLKHFFRISFRNISKNRVYSAINIAGLSTGLAGFIIVLLYLNYELSYDTWSPELKKMYKISARTDEEVLEQTPAPLARFLASNAPGIEAATKVQSAGEFEVPLSAGDTRIYGKGSIEVDSLFLKVFPYKIISGDAATALNKPNAILITQELSQQLFGSSNPIGKTIRIFNSFDTEVTAVIESPKGPSHLNVQFAWRSPYEKGNEHWNNRSYTTYVKTKQAQPATKLEAAINPVYYDNQLKQGTQTFADFRAAGHQAGLFADPVGRLHNFPSHGSSQFPTVTVLVVLAFLLLVAGAINFSNLSIAASIRRAKEVGIRKTLGSTKRQLLGQFLGETALQCLMSLILALVAVKIILPYFARTFNIELSLFDATNGWSIALQVGICLVLVILLSGLYPALFLSVLNTTRVLKGEYSRGNKGRNFRNALIVVQFAVAAFFVFGTLVINRQIRYMQTRDKGFNGEQVMRIQAMQGTRDAKFETTRTTLMQLPGVEQVAKTTEVPGDANSDTSTYSFRFESGTRRLASVKVSNDYFSTLRIGLVKGRLFDERYADQHTRSVILNESAAKQLGTGDMIGKTIYFAGCDTVPLQVIGVVRDFLVQGLEHAVQPVAYTIGNNACMFQSGGALLVKINAKQVTASIAAIQQAWKKIEPDLPIRYTFLDDNFARLFASYLRLQTIISLFTLIAILISVIGLFAMTAYLTGQRNKEIGVRKVLGASVTNIATMLSKDFVRLVVVATLIATPLGYWATSEWLQTFAYRIPLSWWLFAISGLAVLLIALITIGLQTLKAAMANPVKSLRSE